MMRHWLSALLTLACAAPGFAASVDEVVLKNGRRYLGTIVASTPTTVMLAIDGGTVEFPRSIIVSPPYLAPPPPEETPATGAGDNPPSAGADARAPHPLPDVARALEKLSEFPWVTQIRQVPVLVTGQGRWQFLPGVSFWVEFFQLSFLGDPARPSAIEISLHQPLPTAWEHKRRLLEYVLNITPELAVDNRFDALNLEGDQFAFGDLWLEVTGPDSAKTPGRWAVLLLHETSLNAARASYDEIELISELITTATIDPNKPRSWQRATWLPEELTWLRDAPGMTTMPAVEAGAAPRTLAFTALGGERVFVRAYVRERSGSYVRANYDWTREFVLKAR